MCEGWSWFFSASSGWWSTEYSSFVLGLRVARVKDVWIRGVSHCKMPGWLVRFVPLCAICPAVDVQASLGVLRTIVEEGRNHVQASLGQSESRGRCEQDKPRRQQTLPVSDGALYVYSVTRWERLTPVSRRRRRSHGSPGNEAEPCLSSLGTRRSDRDSLVKSEWTHGTADGGSRRWDMDEVSRSLAVGRVSKLGQPAALGTVTTVGLHSTASWVEF